MRISNSQPSTHLGLSAFGKWIVVKDSYVWFLWQIFGFNLGILLG